MIAFLIIGIILTLAGLAGLGVCIKRAAAARAMTDPEEVKAHLHGLVALNLGSVALSGLGLALVVVGLIL